MTEAQLFVLQDEFTCSLCMETLRDPISILCGHSFCLKCLTNYWDQSQVCSCPQCRRTFTTRPELHINTLLNEVVKKLKKKAIGRPPPPPPLSHNFAGPGDVECDFCTGKKLKAIKSCLTCTASYCRTHLQPHYEGAIWKDHRLTDPDVNLKEKLCAKHQKSLEIFCKTDEMCICAKCVVTEHNNHKMAELEKEREEKQKQLESTLIEILEKLEKREKKLKEMRRAVEQMKISVKKEVEENKKSFADLICCIEEAERKLIERIKEQEKREVEKAEAVIELLEKEIEELKRRTTELNELSETKDLIHFLQTFVSPSALPVDGDLFSFTVTADLSSEDLRKELSCLKKSLEKISQWDIMTTTVPDCDAPVFILQSPEPQSREEFLQYSCPLTLDINTAHRGLRLSEGNKKVTCERAETKYPDHPDRFDCWYQILCREALARTRFYWEVECRGDEIVIGVTYKGLCRKGGARECSLGYNDKSWCLLCSHFQYSVYHNSRQTVMSSPYSPRIGIFLDCPAGSLSFYSISHTMTLLHKFNTLFTEPLYLGFRLGWNSSVIICHLTPCVH